MHWCIQHVSTPLKMNRSKEFRNSDCQFKNCDVKNHVSLENFLYNDTLTHKFLSSVQDNPFSERINKVKELIHELEESFRESSNVGNNLILRCVLLRAENQNLIHKIDEKNRNRNLTTTLYNKHWELSVLSQQKSKSVGNTTSKKRLNCTSHSSLNQPFILRNCEEVDILHKTIGDLQKKLKDRDHKIETLCQKYLYLKTNKNKMESDLKSKILSLEMQLDLAYKTLSEFQEEVDTLTGKILSQTKHTYEALFLQEKSRCSKLMYENVKLQHEIKRLEDVIRRQSVSISDENQCWKVVKSSLDKCTSEPFMRHF